MTTLPTSDRSITRAAWAFIAQSILTSLHHVYGGLEYDSVLRLSMPLVAGTELLLVLGLLRLYRRSRRGLALAAFSVVAILVGVVQGLFHVLYGHVYKDLLFLVGVSADRIRDFFQPALPNDFIYPPNDWFFELTGLLQLGTVGLIVLATYRLAQTWRAEQDQHETQACTT